MFCLQSPTPRLYPFVSVKCFLSYYFLYYVIFTAFFFIFQFLFNKLCYLYKQRELYICFKLSGDYPLVVQCKNVWLCPVYIYSIYFNSCPNELFITIIINCKNTIAGVQPQLDPGIPSSGGRRQWLREIEKEIKNFAVKKIEERKEADIPWFTQKANKAPARDLLCSRRPQAPSRITEGAPP